MAKHRSEDCGHNKMHSFTYNTNTNTLNCYLKRTKKIQKSILIYKKATLIITIFLPALMAAQAMAVELSVKICRFKNFLRQIFKRWMFHCTC